MFSQVCMSGELLLEILGFFENFFFFKFHTIGVIKICSDDLMIGYVTYETDEYEIYTYL